MAFINSNNFCSWVDSDNILELTTDGDMNACSGSLLTYWTENDTSPLGSNVDSWNCGSGVADLATNTGPWSKGLSQAIQIKKGQLYYVKLAASAPFGGVQNMYILFVDANNNYQTAKKVSGIASTTTEYDFFVIADANYSKIMAVSEDVSAVTFTTPISYLKLNEVLNSVDDTCQYALPVIEGDALSIWFNGELDDSAIPFSGLQLDLYLNNTLYIGNVATLNQIVISGDIYSFYFTYTVPLLAKGNYRFVLSDGLKQYYISNSFIKATNKDYTSIIKYKNSINTLGFKYESAPTIYNQLRVDLWRGRATYPNSSTGYETYEGGFIRVKSDIQKLIQFETRFFNEVAHEAFASMLLHDEIYVDGIEYNKPEGQNYDIAWSEDDENIIGNGVINLQVTDYSASIQSC